MKKLLVKILSIAAAAAMAFSLTGCFPEKRSGAEQYDKAYYIREYGGDFSRYGGKAARQFLQILAVDGAF